jgi:hypothetical protein
MDGALGNVRPGTCISSNTRKACPDATGEGRASVLVCCTPRPSGMHATCEWLRRCSRGWSNWVSEWIRVGRLRPKRKSGRPSFLGLGACRHWMRPEVRSSRRSSSLKLGPPHGPQCIFLFPSTLCLKEAARPSSDWGSSKLLAVVRGVRNCWNC